MELVYNAQMTEGTVRGTVTIKGKPATKGEVVFDPSNYERPNAEAHRAPIQEDGSYEVTTQVEYNMVQIDPSVAGRLSETQPDLWGGHPVG